MSPNQRANLFIIGAMKSGTTSLHRYLSAHPEIFMSQFKEPGYFVEELNWKQGEEWYLSLFQEGSQHRYRGESSTHYSKLPVYQGVAEKIAEFSPDAKIVYVMRHPFERIVSHYWHEVQQLDAGGETSDIYTACTTKPKYQAFSNYAMQLKPYINCFGFENIYLTTFEELMAAPEAESTKLFNWLDIDPSPDHSLLRQRHNARPETIIGVRGTGMLNRIRNSHWYDKTAKIVPKSIRSRASKLSQIEFDIDSQKEETRKLKLALSAPIRQQVDDLSHITGKDFSRLWAI